MGNGGFSLESTETANANIMVNKTKEVNLTDKTEGSDTDNVKVAHVWNISVNGNSIIVKDPTSNECTEGNEGNNN